MGGLILMRMAMGFRWRLRFERERESELKEKEVGGIVGVYRQKTWLSETNEGKKNNKEMYTL